MTHFTHRSRARVSIVFCVLIGEDPVPDVHAMLALGHLLVAPGHESVLLARPAHKLPLCLRGQPLALPGAVVHGVIPRHVKHRVVHTENTGTILALTRKRPDAKQK